MDFPKDGLREKKIMGELLVQLHKNQKVVEAALQKSLNFQGPAVVNGLNNLEDLETASNDLISEQQHLELARLTVENEANESRLALEPERAKAIADKQRWVRAHQNVLDRIRGLSEEFAGRPEADVRISLMHWMNQTRKAMAPPALPEPPKKAPKRALKKAAKEPKAPKAPKAPAAKRTTRKKKP